MKNKPYASNDRFTKLVFAAVAVSILIVGGYQLVVPLPDVELSQVSVEDLSPTDRIASSATTSSIDPSTSLASGSIEHRSPLERLSPRQRFDTSGYSLTIPAEPWSANASLADIKQQWLQWDEISDKQLELAQSSTSNDIRLLIPAIVNRATKMMSQGKADEAYELLQSGRDVLEQQGGWARQVYLGTVMFFQGVASLRRGENDNCILCRGESSCILPISSAAVHQNKSGSKQAIKHFMEYLAHCPVDLEVVWLLNLAHMTLDEYPDGVDPRYRIPLDNFLESEFNIGRFRDVGHIVGSNRFSQAGGAIMDDFDNDGLFDLVVTNMDVKMPMDVYRNDGKGQFVMRSDEAGIGDQLGGLNCVQADYNNDGLLDIFVIRGAWLNAPIRPTLLRNDGNFRFTDVTAEAGLIHSVNSNSAQWADYDNDGWLDLFICCEQQQHCLYRNLGNGRFEEVAAKAGLVSDGQEFGKGCTWIDVDNDDYPDLFINYLHGTAQLYRNNRDGTFSNATNLLGDGGPEVGFSCWCWDFNNDGWLDIFATCYWRSLQAIVLGLAGQPHGLENSNKLYLNMAGNGFRDVTKEAGLDMSFATMGSNFGDFDSDGYLDFYLATGEPDLSVLVPNRMFRNVHGVRFAEITASAGVGHLQKGHGVSCADWDRDGDVDLFVQTGGAVDGDKFHDVLFQNPGLGRSWVSLKLIGTRTNRAAIGARIKVVTSGDEPLTVHRHVSSGSSFGANPLEQTIGLGGARKIDRIEVHWPTSNTTQVFRNVPINQVIRITEQDSDYQIATPQPITLPEN